MIFKKKKCAKCGEKINSSWDFCPFCGLQISKDRSGEGLLDTIDRQDFSFFNSPLPFGRLLKELSKQFRTLDSSFKSVEPKKSRSKQPKSDVRDFGINISISSGGSDKPLIRLRPIGKPIKLAQKQPPQPKEIKKLSKKEERFAKLPKTEPATTVRRLGNKIIYEIELPEIKSKENIVINRLQNSIEIKAWAKDKAYFKLLPIALPILKYYLKSQKLFLELKPEV